jgi:hypothetical protein
MSVRIGANTNSKFHIWDPNNIILRCVLMGFHDVVVRTVNRSMAFKDGIGHQVHRIKCLVQFQLSFQAFKPKYNI